VTWVPVQLYGKLLEWLAREEGSADPAAYLRRRGWLAADRLLGETYRGYDPRPGTWGRKVMEQFLGITKLLYNFTEWRAEDVPGGLRIEVRGALDLPEPAVLAAHGFLEFVADRASGGRTQVSSERTAPDRVVLTVTER
jgi:hypothetical protein